MAVQQGPDEIPTVSTHIMLMSALMARVIKIEVKAFDNGLLPQDD